jgi:hypothetical protein
VNFAVISFLPQRAQSTFRKVHEEVKEEIKHETSKIHFKNENLPCEFYAAY